MLSDMLTFARAKAPSSLSAMLNRAAEGKYRKDTRGGSWAGMDVFHPSSLASGFCVREKLLSSLRPPGPTPEGAPNLGLQRIFWFGTAIHELYQDFVLGPAGVLYGWWTSPRNRARLDAMDSLPRSYEFERLLKAGDLVEGFSPARFGDERQWAYVEPAIYHAEYHIGGNVDGVLFTGGCTDKGEPNGEPVLLDIKTINSFGFGALGKAPKDAHRAQVTLYLGSSLNNPAGLHVHMLERDLNPTRAVVLYICKNTSSEADLWVDFDQAYFDELTHPIRRLKHGLRVAALDKREDDCKSTRSKRAKRCPQCDLCFAVGHGFPGWEQVEGTAL